MEKITVPIKGMHCASCALVIEKTLKKTEGVNEVKVNYGTEKATHISSETVTTSSSTPDRINDSGKYEEGRHVEQTRTHKTSMSGDSGEKEEHSTETTTSSPNRSSNSVKRIEQTLTKKSSKSEEG